MQLRSGRPRIARQRDELGASLERYLTQCGTTGGVGQQALETYGRDLARFVAFLRRRGIATPAAVSRRDLLAWLSALRQSGQAVATSQRVVYEARAYLRSALVEGAADPFSSLSVPHPTPAPPSALSQEQVLSLLAAPPATRLGWRDRAILAVLYSTGLTLAQLVALDLRHVALDGGVVHRWDSRGRPRPAFLGGGAVAALSQYLADSRPSLVRAADEPALFLSQKGARISRRAVDELVAKYARSLGFAVSPRELRRACALHLRAGGATGVAVRQLLGTHIVGTRAAQRQLPG